MTQPSHSLSDEQCAQILSSVEDYMESQEPDYDPDTQWYGDDWRIGRSSRHTMRVCDKAVKALPAFVIEGTERYFAAQDEDEPCVCSGTNDHLASCGGTCGRLVHIKATTGSGSRAGSGGRST